MVAGAGVWDGAEGLPVGAFRREDSNRFQNSALRSNAGSMVTGGCVLTEAQGRHQQREHGEA